MKQFMVAFPIGVTATAIGSLANSTTSFVGRGAATSLHVISSFTKSPYQLWNKKANGVIETSFEFTNNEIVKVSKLLYNAGIQQVTTITPGTFPAVQKLGDEYILKIINTTPGTMNLPTKTFVAVRKGVDFTATTLCDAFRALIGTNADLKVVSSGTTTLVLTGQTADNHFRVAVNGNFVNAGVVYTNANTPSQGTSAKVKALEAECMSWGKGVTNKVQFADIPATEVGTGNYDITVIEIAQSGGVDASGMKNQKVERKMLYIAETAGTSPIGTLFAAL